MTNIAPQDERIGALSGGRRMWWDVAEQKMVSAATAYVAFGCPDWGETKGKRNGLCTFCALPNAVFAYREAFYGGNAIPIEDHTNLLEKTLKAYADSGEFHTLMIFNAGSFLAMPRMVQEQVMREVGRYPFIQRVVIESRATLINKESLAALTDTLNPLGKKLTIRVGVETKDDHLRLKVLKKGHSRTQLVKAIALMKEAGITSGGYALLNPAPGLDRNWAIAEAVATVNWILAGADSGGLGMDEAYFGPTCVGPNSPLAASWEKDEFRPADLWAVLEVLEAVLPKYQGRVHLLPFVDEPQFLAVPSNHVARGLPESLEGAQGCDLEFHAMLHRYRTTMDKSVLYKITCACGPK